MIASGRSGGSEPAGTTKRRFFHAIRAGFLVVFIAGRVGGAAEYAPLPIGEFLKYAEAESVYPSARQMEMLKSSVPDNSFQPAPPISDRTYWGHIAVTATGREWRERAQSAIDRRPQVPISDETPTGRPTRRAAAACTSRSITIQWAGWRLMCWPSVWRTGGGSCRRSSSISAPSWR